MSTGETLCTGAGCGKPIRFVTTVEGRRMPINPDPSADGTVVAVEVDGQLRARVLTGDELPALEPAWVPHWATCPAAPEFRAKRVRTAPRCRVCEGRMDAELLAKEPNTTHPCCDPREQRALAMARAGVA